MKNLDPFTFGNAQAAVSLADILSKYANKREIRKATSILSDAGAIINGIDILKEIDFNTYNKLLGYLYRYFVGHVDKYYSNYHPLVYSHLRNVLVGKFKSAIRNSKNKRIENIRRRQRGLPPK